MVMPAAYRKLIGIARKVSMADDIVALIVVTKHHYAAAKLPSCQLYPLMHFGIRQDQVIVYCELCLKQCGHKNLDADGIGIVSKKYGTSGWNSQGEFLIPPIYAAVEEMLRSPQSLPCGRSPESAKRPL